MQSISTEASDDSIGLVPLEPLIFNDAMDTLRQVTATDAGATFKGTLAGSWSSWDIKAASKLQAREGHGGTIGMQPADLFTFFMQVSKRYGKCFRSNNVFLIVLPYPGLLLEFLCDNVSVALTDILLLLCGDVQTNPGSEGAVVSKQIQSAVDLREIKLERLTANESKLELLTTFDEKITDYMKQVTDL